MKNLFKHFYLPVIFGLALLTFVSCEKKEDDEELKSSEKQMMTFTFQQLTPVVTATIDQTAHTITATVPEGTDLTTLVPTFTYSNKATVSPASGIATNFTGPVSYTITAEDGTTNAYIATITEDVAGIETLSGSLSENRTLPNISDGIDYIVEGWLRIEGNALLTIEPGVKIVFASANSGIIVDTDAGVKMSGTLAMPIILTGPTNNNNKGAWGGLEYHSNRADNLINYVQIINAGSSNSNGAAVWIYENAQLSITNTLIEGSGTDGLFISRESDLAEFDNNIVRDCAEYPISADLITVIQSISTNNAFTGNGNNMLGVINNEWLDQNCVLKNIGIPYYISGLYTNGSLTVEPGAELKFKVQTMLEIGSTGKLIAEGTANEPIIIGGYEAEAGYWAGIYISSIRDNSMDHCIISDGGYDWYMTANISLWDDAKLTIKNTLLTNSSGYGFQYSNPAVLEHSNVTFSSCALGCVYDSANDEVHTDLP